METKYLTISSKNQITLNKEIRNALDISSGDKVYFYQTAHGFILKKAEDNNICPVCEGNKKILNQQCLICEGQGFLKEKLDSKFIVNKLVSILLNNDIDVDIKTDKLLGYIINSKANEELLDEYISRCQLYIVKDTLSKFIDKGILISSSVKEQFVSLCEDKPYKEHIIKMINDTQLGIIKSVLKEKGSITSEECSKFTEAFDEQYKDSVSKFLLSFVTL